MAETDTSLDDFFAKKDKTKKKGKSKVTPDELMEKRKIKKKKAPSDKKKEEGSGAEHIEVDSSKMKGVVSRINMIVCFELICELRRLKHRNLQVDGVQIQGLFKQLLQLWFRMLAVFFRQLWKVFVLYEDSRCVVRRQSLMILVNMYTTEQYCVVVNRAGGNLFKVNWIYVEQHDHGDLFCVIIVFHFEVTTETCERKICRDVLESQHLQI